MNAKKAIKSLPASEVVSASLSTVDFNLIDNGTLTKACFALKFSNYANQIILISFDGETIHESIWPQHEFVLGNFRDYSFAKGTKIYMRRAGAASGTVYVSKYYVDSSPTI